MMYYKKRVITDMVKITLTTCRIKNTLKWTHLVRNKKNISNYTSTSHNVIKLFTNSLTTKRLKEGHVLISNSITINK